MRASFVSVALLAASISTGVGACSPAPTPPDESEPAPLEIGEERQLELRFLRFDVSNYERAMTKADLQALPLDLRERMWLLDLDLSNGPSSPRLLENAVAAMTTLDPSTLSPAAQNLQRLLLMTPDTADLRRTSLERLIELAPLLGIAPARVLADLLEIDVEDTFLDTTRVTEAILNGVIGSHPNARQRPGPRTPANPDGIYPVPKGSLPISLEDILTGGATLSQRYGAVQTNGAQHPGFVSGETKLVALTDDFKIKVRVNANALPYKGVDLGNVSSANVNSIPSQIKTLFDFEDPRWLTVEGLVPGGPVVDTITFRIVESPLFVPGGRLPTPSGVGSSAAWQLPEWTLERLVLGAAQSAYANVDAAVSYMQPGRADPLVRATVKAGWQEITTKEGIGASPPPSYLWDVLLEVAQVRLHDGGLAEGGGNAELTLRGIPIGVDSQAIEKTIRENLAADPSGFVEVAKQIIDTSYGAADVYYYRADPRKNAPDKTGDYLFFIAPSDIGIEQSGQPKRPYRYAHPGFYSDEALTQKISTTDVLDGDAEHEKVRIDDGRAVYVEDDDARVFRLEAGTKTSESRRAFTIRRIR